MDDDLSPTNKTLVPHNQKRFAMGNLSNQLKSCATYVITKFELDREITDSQHNNEEHSRLITFDLNKALRRAEREIRETPPEERVAKIPRKIAYKAFEGIASEEDPILQEMYISLITKCIKKETCHLVHPSFSYVIDQLSPDEALILCRLRDVKGWPGLYFTAGEDPLAETKNITKPLMIRTGLEKPEAFTGFKVTINVPKAIELYIVNLEALGIVRRRTAPLSDPDPTYEELTQWYEEEIHTVQKQLAGLGTTIDEQYNRRRVRTMNIEHGHLEVTEFGGTFLTACVPENYADIIGKMQANI